MRVFRQRFTGRDGKTKQSRKWYVEFKDHLDTARRIPGFTDKGLTVELGRKLEKLVSLRVLGDTPGPEITRWLESLPADLRRKLADISLLDSRSVASGKPLNEHLNDFKANLRNAGRSEEYCNTVTARATRIIERCGFQVIGGMSASRVQACLADLKNEGLGQRTVNHYLQAIKQFTRWLVSDRRAGENPLAHLRAGNAQLDVRRERREMATDEILKLLEATLVGMRIYGLTGWERYTLYAAALGTGLRAKELASLTPKHCELNVELPTVRIDAADEKSRRGDVIPLPADLTRLLKQVIAHLEPAARLWPGTWAEKRRGSKMIQHDLNQAGVPYRTDEGQADFHSLRHTYLSRLGRSGASPKAMQRLARHTSVELTIGRYTHASLYDLASAVDGLPALPLAGSGAEPETEELKATGTDSADAILGNVLPLRLPAQPAFGCDSVQSSAVMGRHDDTEKTEVLEEAVGETPRKNQENMDVSHQSGSGRESNPPGDFSAATLGLKPRAVTRSAYTPGRDL